MTKRPDLSIRALAYPSRGKNLLLASMGDEQIMPNVGAVRNPGDM
jgi:hypothetical protein